MVFKQLKALLQRQSTCSLAQLANGLSADQELVAMMLDYLMQQGKVKKVLGNCTIGCRGCSIALQANVYAWIE